MPKWDCKSGDAAVGPRSASSGSPRRGLTAAVSARHTAQPPANREMGQAGGSQHLLGCNRGSTRWVKGKERRLW